MNLPQIKTLKIVLDYKKELAGNQLRTYKKAGRARWPGEPNAGREDRKIGRRSPCLYRPARTGEARARPREAIRYSRVCGDSSARESRGDTDRAQGPGADRAIDTCEEEPNGQE
jgi:hypothetical protein